MKIVLTGGGSGGHFYPLVSVAQQIRKVSEEKKLLQPDIFYIADNPYDEDILFKNNIVFKKVSAGKMRGYFSVLNFFDLFKTAGGLMKAFVLMLSIYPDVVFSNGGFGSFPILFVAKFLKIPVVIHCSDTVPGRVVKWASKFAKKISVGFPDASNYLPTEKVAYTGNPVRRGLDTPLEQGAHEFLKLDKNTKTILVLGGSLGAQIINDIVVDILPKLVEKYQVIHQTGVNNFEEVKNRARLVLEKSGYKERYKIFKFLDLLALRMSAGASDLVISRAGAGTVSEVSIWGLPSIVIPITSSSGDHQRQNAFSYARATEAVVIEEKNLTPNILLVEIDRLMNNEEMREEMSQKAKEFSKPEAARTIADGIIEIMLKHEK